MSPPAIDADGLVVSLRGRTILRGVDLTCDGEVTALVGPNGAGKSVLLRTLATLHRIRDGDASISGSSLRTAAGRRSARHRLGYLAQRPSPADRRLRVRDALEYAAWLHRLRGGEARRAIAEAVEAFGIEPLLSLRLAELSGGTRQRVALATAVISRPEVVLLDEPTAGVDVEHRAEQRAALRALAQRSTLLIATHLSEDVDLLADRVVALSRGEVAFTGTREELRSQTDDADPVHPLERLLRSLAHQQAPA